MGSTLLLTLIVLGLFTAVAWSDRTRILVALSDPWDQLLAELGL